MAQRLKTDWTLFLTIVGMVCFGIVMVYSASTVMAEVRFKDSNRFLLRQVGWAVAGVLLLMISNMYYALPNIKQSAASVLPGACITLALWYGAAWLLTTYLSEFTQVNLIYGSLGSFIAALLFFYVINVIFIFGAEFNYLLMKAFGERIVQKEKA